MAKAFEEMRILDLTQVIAGPSCALQLSLLGADVIKIEPPKAGDQMRDRVLASKLAPIGMAAAFMSMNIGKRSLALDIKTERGKEILFDLIRGADAILHNFRAGVVDRLGLDYESVRAVNPGIVYTVISGFGSTGPKAGDPAYDGAIQAASGMMANNGTEDTGPLRTGYMPVDLMTGMSAAFATTAALLRRQRTGEGQMVDVAMLDCAIVLLAANFSRYLVDEVPDARIGNQSIAGIPTASSFPTAEGDLLSAAIMSNHAESFLDELGLGHLLSDPRFASRDAMIENSEALRDNIIEALKADSASNWERRIMARGVPVAKINAIAETAVMEQLDHRNILTDVPNPDGVDGPLRLVGAPYTNSVDGPEALAPPPTLGQHSRDVLTELGIVGTDLETLINDGVVGTAS